MPANAECEADISAIESSNKIQRYELGDSNQPSGVWIAFQNILAQVAQCKSAAHQLLESKSPVARFYGLYLLKQTSAGDYKNYLDRLSGDKTRVLYASGCAFQETTLADLMARIKNGEELVALKDPRESAMIKLANEYIKEKGYNLPKDTKISTQTAASQFIVTYGGPPPAGVRGADYLVKVFINSRTAQVEKCLAGP